MENSKIAAHLLQIKAVRLSVSEPFTWASGWKSPIYCDNRLALSYPEVRKDIVQGFVEEIRRLYPQAAGLAGVATGAIAWGALAAEQLGLPFMYIRSQAKGHGLQNMIEGRIEEGASYVVIEDLISTGKSSAQAVQALQAAGGKVLGTLAIFSYGFPQAEQAFAATGTGFSSLTNLSTLLQKAAEFDYLRPEEQEAVFTWQQNPEAWTGSAA
ncbi:MAG: orotate phosphoribosyltransferase [Bacteroidetes bacterium]|nr:MAG: orotate phosphoribosyltransferase [Bacteroidota bacterium]